MRRRVHWIARGVAFLDGLEGSADVSDRDVLPVTAALRALQRRSGLEVIAFGGSGVRSSGPGRCYSVRLARPGERPTGCMLIIEPEFNRDVVRRPEQLPTSHGAKVDTSPPDRADTRGPGTAATA